jgi:hypothetical protein
MRRRLYSVLAISLLFSCVNLSTNPPKHAWRISFIGNSFFDEGVDMNTVNSRFGGQVQHVCQGGVATAWFYATLLRQVLVDSVPEYAVMPSSLNLWTTPAIRTIGTFWLGIESVADGFPQIIDSVNAVLKSAQSITDDSDFTASVNFGYLPRIIALAKQHNIKLVLTGMRILDNVRNPSGDTGVYRKYREALAAYCFNHDAIFLDYTYDPETEWTDFEDDWHLNPVGKKKWTAEIIKDFQALVQGQEAFHQWTGGQSRTTPAAIELPQRGGTIASETDVTLKTASGSDTKWSFCSNNDPDGERFLGSGSPLTVKIPPFDKGRRSIRIFAYNGVEKAAVACTLSTDSGANVPPRVDGGPDLISYVGRETRLTAVASDDKLSPEALRYAWDVLRGDATLKDGASPSPTFTPLSQGLVVFCVTVSDGEYEAKDIVSCNVTGRSSFIISSPIDGEPIAPGDTVIIRWQVIDVKDCMISVSYDAGKSFDLIPNALLSLGSPHWGSYPWIVPLDAPETDVACLKLANYAGTVATISLPFSVHRRK